ncbi:response regulator [Paenibacillus sp. FSL H7-0756]|uniref:response regulator n=1 Tax=Paenibacillus sp. FSL H7-0756 TaxID=2954738 RepID=UPI0030FB1CDA
MYRVIIVEDEFIVRYGIRSMIEWEAIGMEVTGEAGNGREALELMAAGLPDILITDIKMPVMDGIELIAEVRKLSPDLKILILSNLEDFQYAKEAIRHSVSDYIIKSDMMPRDFEQVLLKLKQGLDEALKPVLVHAAPVQAEAVAVHKESLLLELLERGAVHGLEASREALVKAGLAGVPPLYLLHVVPGSGSELRYARGAAAIRSVLAELWQDAAFGYELIPDRQGAVQLIVTAGMNGQADGPAVLGRLRSLGEELIQRLCEQYGWTVTIGISGPIEQWGALKDAYEEAAGAAGMKLFLGTGRVLVHGSPELLAQEGPGAQGTQLQMAQPQAQQTHIHRSHPDATQLQPQAQSLQISSLQIQSMVYAFQSRELEAYLEQLFGQLAMRRDAELVQIITLELLMILTTLWPDVSRDAEQVLELKKQYFDELSKLETLEENRLWFLQAFQALISHMKEMYNSDRNSIIKATQYIQQYYHQEITLQSISRLVHLSKNYFANLFRKEVGESFLEYLTRIRIEKAMTLLTGELKAGDVGSLVGIQDPKYFSKVFKKITGLSPSEFRALARKEQ